MNKIPALVQTFKKCDPPEEIIPELLEVFHHGGIEIDEEMSACNPNARKTVPFVSSSDPVELSDSKIKMNYKESMGNWIYCGHKWYVRKTSDYEFAQFLAYQTCDKSYVGPWDAREHTG